MSGTARSVTGRPRSSSISMMLFTRVTSLRSTAVYSPQRASSPSSRCMSCTAPRMAESGLRISWARPTAIWPAAARVSPRRTSDSSWRRREMSRTTATADVTAPLRPASGAVSRLTCTVRPSGTSITAEDSERLSPVASVSVRCRTRDVSGGKTSLRARPVTRRAERPRSSSAAGFHRMIRRSASTPTRASGSPLTSAS